MRFVLTDIKGKNTVMLRPLTVSLVSSKNAPADSLSCSFAVEGSREPLVSVLMEHEGEALFYGLVDRQGEEYTKNGRILTVTARSREAVLLDNEACPQTYCAPSMPVLMKRHFEPLGFCGFCGTDKAFGGELTVKKGMSEWSVLKEFCRRFTGTEPRLTPDGTIDISGEHQSGRVILSPEHLLSLRREYRRDVRISEIRARTYMGGGYDMPASDDEAAAESIRRVRYYDALSGSGKGVPEAFEMIRKSRAASRTLRAEAAGSLWCRPGDTLVIDGEKQEYVISEVIFTYDINGEKTVIEGEVKVQ